MAGRTKQQAVTISFHYLEREEGEEGETSVVAFTTKEFNDVYTGLNSTRNLDYSDEKIMSEVRNRHLAPINSIERLNARTITGVYDGSYWGHAQTNTHVGDIPADSITFTPFFFALYHSENGRIYIISQYLGNFGGYEAIKSTVLRFLAEKQSIKARAINVGGFQLRDVRAKRVEIKFAKHAAQIAARNQIGKAGCIVFKKVNRDDEVFADQVNDVLLEQETPAAVRRAVHGLLQESGVTSINEDDIEDCTVIAQVGQNEKTIHLLQASNFATRFPVAVSLNADGHPTYEEIREKALELLQREVIARQINE